MKIKKIIMKMNNKKHCILLQCFAYYVYVDDTIAPGTLYGEHET